MRITICGGGNIAHSLAAVLSGTDDVSILTRRPEKYGSNIGYERDGNVVVHNKILATDDVSIVAHAELIIIALPKFAIDKVLKKIAHGLHHGQTVAFIPAPCGLEIKSAILHARYGVDTIGFQRVPYVARIIEYGKLVRISHDRRVHKLVISDSAKKSHWCDFFSSRFGGTIEWLSSFLSFTFSNSNSLLHPARLAVLLQKDRYEKMPLFYEEWTDESSSLYVNADSEMLAIMRFFPEIDISTDYESAFQHYEVSSVSGLTQKIRSIPAFKDITSPYKLDESGWYVPDLESRYFTEDVPFGTVHIQEYARKVGVKTPTIDYFISRIMGALHD